ncbi:GTPase-activating protein [Balamuthia mandrillaris]
MSLILANILLQTGYKDIEDDARRKKRANEIYAKYIMSSSPYELNLPWVLRQEVAGRLSEATVDTFQNVQKDMFVLMANTNFDQFLRSDIYKRFKGCYHASHHGPSHPSHHSLCCG